MYVQYIREVYMYKSSILSSVVWCSDIELEGYLFKKSSGAFKTWNRRWFVLRNSQLCYQSESKTEVYTVYSV